MQDGLDDNGKRAGKRRLQLQAGGYGEPWAEDGIDAVAATSETGCR